MQTDLGKEAALSFGLLEAHQLAVQHAEAVGRHSGILLSAATQGSLKLLISIAWCSATKDACKRMFCKDSTSRKWMPRALLVPCALENIRAIFLISTIKWMLQVHLYQFIMSQTNVSLITCASN